GVLAGTDALNGIAVSGYSGHGSAAKGVYGASDPGYGVYGTTITGTGVYGTSTGAGSAGIFNGNVVITGSLHVTGNLSKGSGSFQIDDPLDPANKYLYHSFVESPDMMDIYNGNVTTDANGEATVTMPAWFQTLNRDFRYQLT